MDARVTSTRSTNTLAKLPRPATLDEATKARIYRQHLQGTSVEALADQFGRSTSGMLKIVNEMRARRVLDLKIEAMPHESFDDPKLADEILAPLPKPVEGKVPARSSRPKACRPTWPACTTSRCCPGSRRPTCSAR